MNNLKVALLQLLPKKYQLLVSENIEEPFIRNDYRK